MQVFTFTHDRTKWSACLQPSTGSPSTVGLELFFLEERAAGVPRRVAWPVDRLTYQALIDGGRALLPALIGALTSALRHRRTLVPDSSLPIDALTPVARTLRVRQTSIARAQRRLWRARRARLGTTPVPDGADGDE